jgi:hypothetical protein
MHVHGILDYVVALVLILSPIIFGFDTAGLVAVGQGSARATRGR